jgi:hypothetical protein
MRFALIACLVALAGMPAADDIDGTTATTSGQGAGPATSAAIVREMPAEMHGTYLSFKDKAPPKGKGKGKGKAKGAPAAKERELGDPLFTVGLRAITVYERVKVTAVSSGLDPMALMKGKSTFAGSARGGRGDILIRPRVYRVASVTPPTEGQRTPSWSVRAGNEEGKMVEMSVQFSKDGIISLSWERGDGKENLRGVAKPAE